MAKPYRKPVLAPLPDLRHDKDMKSSGIYAGLFVVAALAGCTDFPELDGTVSPAQEAGAFPKPVPLGPLLARAEGSQITDETSAGIAARVARLRARAARLKGSVVDSGTRARMRDGVAPIEG